MNHQAPFAWLVPSLSLCVYLALSALGGRREPVPVAVPHEPLCSCEVELRQLLEARGRYDSLRLVVVVLGSLCVALGSALLAALFCACGLCARCCGVPARGTPEAHAPLRAEIDPRSAPPRAGSGYPRGDQALLALLAQQEVRR